jgi:cytochrome c-type biogenesis protein CcmE
MTHRYIKIGVTAVVLIAAFAGLMWTTLQDGTEYYKHVDEVMTDRAKWENKPMQLHGFVVPGSILRKPDSFEYRFQLQNNGKVVNASYEGIVPDTFQDESEVVLSGKLTPDGFHTKRDGIMAKCPSKYEEKKGGGPGLEKKVS